ncbi:MAG TPA: hypothetical protein VNO30_41155 [Kofleriaceae bacterium]|nr:hypothetical protein [Kofleriaceae bacterium]
MRSGRRSIERVLPGALVLALALAAARPAAAEDRVAKADALFAEGVKLRDSNLELACAKFGQSLQLNPQAIGVLLNVAMCDEKQGRTASAVRRYKETRERAIEMSFPEYQKAADQKLAALEPEVPRLTIRFEQPPAPQTKVVIDDQVVPLAALEAVPLDPGERVIVISAPGRIAFQRRITLASRERRDLVVPALQRPTSRRTIGKLTVAGGGVALATGVVLGLVARGRYKDAEAGCAPGDPPLCVKQDYDAIQSARQLGNIGTLVGGAGIAAALVGGYLWLLTPKPSAEHHRVSVVPRVGQGGAGLAVFGRF